MNIETIDKRIGNIHRAIEIAQTDKELARLDNELEILELLKIESEMEMKENENV